MVRLSRKQFLGRAMATAAAMSVGQLDLSAARRFANSDNALPDADPIGPAGNEPFWAKVRQQFTLDDRIINLNNGAVGPQPKSVQDAFVGLNAKINRAPAHRQNPGRARRAGTAPTS